MHGNTRPSGATWTWSAWLALVVITSIASPLQADTLFRPTAAKSLLGAEPVGAYRRVAEAELNPAMLSPTSPLLRPAPSNAKSLQPSFTLNLFSDAEFPVVVTKSTAKGTDRFTTVGKVQGQPQSQVILTVAGDVLTGSIFVPGRNPFQISYAGNGVHTIAELDPGKFPSCGNHDLPPIPKAAVAVQKAGGGTPAMAADGETQIDIMVVYTAAARTGAGGTNGIESLVDAAIAEANEVYVNSGVDVALNLVYRGEVTYTESGVASTDLTRLQSSSDGQLDAVHTLRAQYGADVVVLITESMATYAGLGYVMSPVSTTFSNFAFAVVKRQYAVGSYVFAHEVGHVMGCQHDRDNASSAGAYDYSYGYRFSDSTGNVFRTVMAYSPGTRIPYFSTSDTNITYAGEFIGVAEGETNSADNAASINNAAPTIAGFFSESALLNFEVTSTNVTEAGTTLTFNVLRTGRTNNAVSVGYTTRGGSATASSDYRATNGVLSFATNEVSKSLSVALLDDSSIEAAETFTVALQNATNAALGIDRTLTITITDNDVGFVLSTNAVRVSEGGTNVTITVLRTGDSSGTNSIDFTTSNLTATAGSDYVSTNGTLTFNAGVTTNTFTVSITDDSTLESNETFRVSLSNPTGGAALGSTTNATVTILEDDSALAFSTNAVSVAESAASVTLTVARTGGTNSTVTVDYLTQDGTGTNAVDYFSTNNTLTFGPGVASRTITVTLTNDTSVDGDVNFSVVLTNISGGSLGAYSNSTVTIRDNDSVFAFTTNATSTAETVGNLTITVRRTGGVVGAATVGYATTNGTAASGSDYTARSGSLSFAAGETNKTFTIPITDDTSVETNETFTVRLLNATGEASLGSFNTNVVTIADNDSVISWQSNAVTVAEGAGTVTLTVVRSGTLTSTSTVAYTFRTGSAGSSDYLGTNATLTFAPDETNKTIVASIVNDSTVETNETFSVQFGTMTGGASLSGTNTAVVTITDNDIGLAFSAATYTVSESGTNVTLTVVQTGNTNGSATVDYLTVGVTAGTNDFTGTNGTLSFGAGTNSLTIVVPVTDDSAFEANETFRVVLTNASGANLLGNSNAVVTILEDDATLAFTTNAVSVAENVRTVTLTVARTGGTNTTTTVDYLTENITATNDVDYLGTNNTLTFGPGIASRTVTVTITNDSTVDGDNTFSVVLTNISGGSLGAYSNATVTIRDNDSAFSFSTNAVTAAETVGSVTLTVLRTGGLVGAATVRYATTNDTATAGSDYTLKSGVLSFAAGESNKTFTVSITDDSSVETNEAFNVVLSTPTGESSLGTHGTNTITIADNDSLISWQTNAVSVAEGAGTVTLTLLRSGTLTATSTVAYTFRAGSAGSSDFLGTNGTVTFGANETNKTIVAGIVNDSAVETNEVFTVQLGTTTGGASLSGTNTIAVTITDNDIGLAFAAATYSVSEAGTNVTLTVVQTGDTNSSATVDYVTVGLTAGTNDFVGTNGTLNFAAGTNSLTIVVPITDDVVLESNETFRVVLTNATGATLLATSNAVVTILENDSTLAFTTNAVEVAESLSSVTLTVVRVGGTNSSETVDFVSAAGTATDGADYTGTNGTLSFGPGIRTRTITVPLANDSSVEGNETFTLSLTNITNGFLGSVSNVTVTVLDNDSVFGFTTNAASVAENAGTTIINVRRTGGTVGAATVTYTTSNSTAVAGSDFNAKSGVLRFAAGETNKTIAITIRNDLVVESNETFRVVLSNPTGEATLGTNPVTITVVDNDFSVGDTVRETGLGETRIARIHVDENGRAVLTIEGALGSGAIVESSTDLTTWTPFAEVVIYESVLLLPDPASVGQTHTYYRVRVPEADTP
jgi:hypothetical protein